MVYKRNITHWQLWHGGWHNIFSSMGRKKLHRGISAIERNRNIGFILCAWLWLCFNIMDWYLNCILMHDVIYIHDTLLYRFHVAQELNIPNLFCIKWFSWSSSPCSHFTPTVFSFFNFFFSPHHLVSIYGLMAIRLSDQLLCITI